MTTDIWEAKKTNNEVFNADHGTLHYDVMCGYTIMAHTFDEETAKYIADCVNIINTPDVLELVRYGLGVNLLGLYIEPMADGQYVRHDQAAASIGFERNMTDYWKAVALGYKAKLAQINDQKPIMCLYDRDNGDGTYSKVTEIFPLPKHARPIPNSVTTLLYAAPVASEAETIERLRDALEFYRDGFKYHPKRTSTGVNLSEWKPTTELLDDCGEKARSALSQNGGTQS